MQQQEQPQPQSATAVSSNRLLVIKSFYIAGVQYRPANVIDNLTGYEDIVFTAEPQNQYDKNAIKIETIKSVIEDVPDGEHDPQEGVEYQHIGYVPKGDTWLFHLLRVSSVSIFLKLDVNPDAEPHRKLLVTVAVEPTPNLPFICHSLSPKVQLPAESPKSELQS